MSKFIVPIGYMGSGSSAVTDLISEIDCVDNKSGSFEYIFLHCPNGVFDLEDKLLIGNNAIRSDEAIHSFYETMKDLNYKRFWWPSGYKKIFHNKFMDIVNQYIEEIIDIKIDSFWYYQENPKSFMYIKVFFERVIRKLFKGTIHIKKPLRYETMWLSYKSEEEFYRLTNKFISNILSCLSYDKADIVIDQLILPHNLYRVPKYFDDKFYFIVVERDPRDIFILNKYIWSGRNTGVPYSRDVEQFCEQYKAIRKMERSCDNINLFKIKFEDLVYNYEMMCKKIFDFLGYDCDKHTKQYQYFDPAKSIKNTQVYLMDPKYNDEVKYIEKHLSSYLYDFPYANNTSVDEIFD